MYTQDTPAVSKWLQSVADNATWRTEESTRKVHATLTAAPCTSKCWDADGDTCCCSCGGKNHGKGYAS